MAVLLAFPFFPRSNDDTGLVTLKGQQHCRDAAPPGLCTPDLAASGAAIDASHIPPVTIRKCLHFLSDS
jgi:hypothetical protein